MRTVSNDFLSNIVGFGKELDIRVATHSFDTNTFTYVEGTSFNEYLYRMEIYFKSDMLKTCMRELVLEYEKDNQIISSNVQIGDVVCIQLGVKLDNVPYQYVDLGKFIINEINDNKDNNSITIKAYDYMILTMVEHDTPLELTYPCTLSDYLDAISTKFGFTITYDHLNNDDMVLESDPYLDENENSLGYTYRDILDEICEATGGIMDVDESYNLRLKYLSSTKDLTIDNTYLKEDNVSVGEHYGPINCLTLSRSADSDNISIRDEASIIANGLCEIKISDNQLLNTNDRGDYAQEIFNQINGLEWQKETTLSSTGIACLEIGDRLEYLVDNNTYNINVFENQLVIESGIEENIYSNTPQTSETDYKVVSDTDKTLNQAYIIVNKQTQEIEAVTSKTNTLETTVNNNYQELNDKFNGYVPTGSLVEIQNSVTQLQTDTYTKTQIDTKLIDGSVKLVQTASATYSEDGMTYEKSNANTKTTINEVGVNVRNQNDDSILFAGYVDDDNTQYSDFRGQTIVASENILVKKYMVVGEKSRFENYEDGTGCFFIG